MSLRTTSRGFALTEVLLIGAVAALVAFAGYAVLKQNTKADTTPTAAEQQQSAVTPAAANVQNAADLTAAEQALDQTSIDTTTDASELGVQVNDL